VLFVCSLNRCRSATAERVFRKREDLDVRSAGTNIDALVRVSRRMLDWADIIFTMDDTQRQSLERMFPTHKALSGLICLGIAEDLAILARDAASCIQAVDVQLKRLRPARG